MRMTSKASLILAMTLAAAGCGDQAGVVTDPTKLTPLTDEQKNAMRDADKQVEDEEHANPTKPQKGKGGSR